MMYRVTRHFTDLMDNNHKYKENDVYPRNGHKPSAERIAELSTDKNALATVLIVPDMQIADADASEKETKPKRRRKSEE